MCLITSDAYEDPMLGKAASVKFGQIRSVICVPLIAHHKVYRFLSDHNLSLTLPVYTCLL
jgi:adenylate cyclase